jgi:lipopolysaccharide/colanic/teichoic acid biosynthesis glycosyltransferase
VQAIDIPNDIFARRAPLRTAFERLVAAAGLLLLSPVFLVLLISGAPLVRLRRVGRFGREFDLLRSRGHGFIAGLPQLWNLLKGDVGLVGPLPAKPGAVDPCDPILSARPGLVDCGVNSLYYLQVRTFGSDLAILLRTIFARATHASPLQKSS